MDEAGIQIRVHLARWERSISICGRGAEWPSTGPVPAFVREPLCSLAHQKWSEGFAWRSISTGSGPLTTDSATPSDSCSVLPQPKNSSHELDEVSRLCPTSRLLGMWPFLTHGRLFPSDGAISGKHTFKSFVSSHHLQRPALPSSEEILQLSEQRGHLKVDKVVWKPCGFEPPKSAKKTLCFSSNLCTIRARLSGTASHSPNLQLGGTTENGNAMEIEGDQV